MKRKLLTALLLGITSIASSQDANVQIGLNAPAYGVKIKANWPGANGGWTRGYQIVNQNDSEIFISMGAYGNINNGVSSLTYGYIGNAYNTPFMVFKPDGNIGIGTKEPTSKLQVTSNDNPTITIGENGANTNGKSTLRFVSGLGSTSWNVFRMEYTKNGSTDKLDFIDGGNKEVLTLKNGGNVGIGTDTPKDKLDVDGSIVIKYGEGIPTIASNINSGIFFYPNGSTSGATMKIDRSGNIGIGTTTPDSKLAVNGAIHAKEVKVDLTGWPDYVFTTNYKLPTLEEVEKHIKEKGHLVNIPSAKEVEKDGIELGEMNKKLLEKIEELTLYTIQQEKKIKKQERKLKKEEERNKKLEERLSKIETLLKKIK